MSQHPHDPDRPAPAGAGDEPTFGPPAQREHFWPYADLPEQPSPEELSALDPDLHAALFGTPPGPFSITLVFPPFDGTDYPRALGMAKEAREYREVGRGDERRHRATFYSTDAVELRELFQLVGRLDACDVLVDGRPVPYARELWLPLVWFLIPQ